MSRIVNLTFPEADGVAPAGITAGGDGTVTVQGHRMRLLRPAAAGAASGVLGVQALINTALPEGAPFDFECDVYYPASYVNQLNIWFGSGVWDSVSAPDYKNNMQNSYVMTVESNGVSATYRYTTANTFPDAYGGDDFGTPTASQPLHVHVSRSASGQWWFSCSMEGQSNLRVISGPVNTAHPVTRIGFAHRADGVDAVDRYIEISNIVVRIGASPTHYAGAPNLTGWLDGGQQKTKVGYAYGADNQYIIDRYGGDKHWEAATLGNRAILQPNRFPTGRDGLVFDGVDDNYVGIQNAGVMSNILAADSYTFFASMIVYDVSTNAANTWANCALWGETSENMGTYLKSSGPTIMAYNWDTADTHNDLTFTLGVPFIYMQRHDGGRLYSSINMGNESSVASGNTDTAHATANLRIGHTGSGGYFNGVIGDFIFFYYAMGAADCAAMKATLIDKWLREPIAPAGMRG